MQDPPRNRHERGIAVPSTGSSGCTCYNLRPGSVLYLPPGHWHSVASAADTSFSVDVRIGNVVHPKWISEAIFAGLMGTLRGGVESDVSKAAPPLMALGPRDFDRGAFSANVEFQAQHVAANIQAMLRRCRMPRCFPFDPEHSDGLHTGATLQFLEERGFMAAAKDLRSRATIVGVSGLVALAPKLRGTSELVVHLRSTSALSGMDYLNFSLLCGARLHGALCLLACRGEATLGALHDECDAEARQELTVLLRVLLHANVLYAEEVEHGQQEAQAKRRRKRPVA